MIGQNIARWEIQAEIKVKKGGVKKEAGKSLEQQDVLENRNRPEAMWWNTH